MYLDDLLDQNIKCLASFLDEKWICNKKLGHANIKLVAKLSKNDLVKGLPKIKYDRDTTYEPCQKEKLMKNSFHSKKVVSTKDQLSFYILIFLAQ